MMSDNLEEIYFAQSEPEAGLVKSRLEAEGVPSWIQSTSALTSFALLPGPCRVMVLEKDLQRAKEILAD